MAIHCSTKVLKLMCFFFGPDEESDKGAMSGPLLELVLTSCSLEPERETSVEGAVTEDTAEGESSGKALVLSSAMIRGGESFLKGRRQLMCVSLFVCRSGGRVGVCDPWLP